MALRLSIDSGAEYLLPFAKKKLAELKAGSLLNRVIEVQSGERIFVQRGLVDQIRITGAKREYFYLTVSGLPRNGLDANEYSGFYFSGGGWHRNVSVPLYPQPGFDVAILDHVRDSVINLLGAEKYAPAAVLCTQYFSEQVTIANATTHWATGTNHDSALYAEVGGSGADRLSKRFTFDPACANAYFWGDEKLQMALEPFYGTFSHSIYPLDPPVRLNYLNQEVFDTIDYFYEAPGTDDTDERGRSIFSRYGPTFFGAQTPMGALGGYTVTAYTYTLRHAERIVTGGHVLNSVTEKLFRRTHAGWVQIYNREAPITYSGTQTFGPYIDRNMPYLEGNSVDTDTDFGGVSVFATSPAYSEYYGATAFRGHVTFDGVLGSPSDMFRPAVEFFLVPGWDGMSVPAVAAAGSSINNLGHYPPFTYTRVGVGAQFATTGNFSPASAPGHVLSTFTCPATGNRYTKTSDGVYSLYPGDGSPRKIISAGVALYRSEFLYYGETTSVRETIPQVGLAGPPPSTDPPYFPEYLKYTTSARLATAQLTLELDEIEDYIAPFEPFGGFCIYHAVSGGVIFGKWLVATGDSEGGVPVAIQSYIDAPSEETFAAVRPLFSIYHQSGLSLSLVILARNGYTLVIA